MFEQKLPLVLGALLTGVSMALARLAHVKLSWRPRMADFARWAAAGEPALGLPEGTFLTAYRENRSATVEDNLEADPVGEAITRLMENVEDWEGPCKELQQKLDELVNEGVRKSKRWPKTPRGLSNHLRRLATFLRESGIDAAFQPRGAKGKRAVRLTRMPDSTVTTVTSVTRGQLISANQPLLNGHSGDGRTPGVTVEPIVARRPSPGELSRNSLKRSSGSGGGDGGGGRIR